MNDVLDVVVVGVVVGVVACVVVGVSVVVAKQFTKLCKEGDSYNGCCC